MSVNTINNLLQQLAVEIAKTHFEINQEIYRNDAVALANDGVTEAEYMYGCDEHIGAYIGEDLVYTLTDRAEKEYRKLVESKYMR